LKTFFHSLLPVFLYGGIVQGIFTVLLLNTGAKKGRANFFLSFLILALSFNIAHMLFAGAVIDHMSARVYSLGDPTFLLIPPLLWFYVLELTGKRVYRSWKLSLHFFPFLAVITCSLTFNSIGSENFARFLMDYHKLLSIIFWIIVVLQYATYQVLVQKRWITYQRLMQQEVSNTENVDISWVRFLMGVFLIINVFFLFSLFVMIHMNGVRLGVFNGLIFSIAVFALGYKGLLQKEIFRKEVVKIPDDKLTQPAYTIDQVLIEQLLKHMEEKKPYLDPELTLSSLAKDISVSRSQLSLLINEGIGDNFYDFINKYRVEQVKTLMVDPAMKNYSMLGLALEAGFKSKSTFNLIFKRFTGLTPTEYRKNLLS
jgi:AraC-like DNA-binding protein